MEKIYDLVQTSNFKFQISSTNAIHFFFSYKDILFDQSSKIPQKTFSEKNFFYGKFSINISTRGIIRSRAQSSVSFILDQRVSSKGSRKKSSQPSFLLARYYSLEFENVTKGLKKTKTKKNKASLEWKSLVCIEKSDADIGGNDAEKLRYNPFAIVPLLLYPFTLCSHGASFVKSSHTFRDKIILSKEGKDSKHSFDSTLLFLLLMDTRLTFRAKP